MLCTQRLCLDLCPYKILHLRSFSLFQVCLSLVIWKHNQSHYWEPGSRWDRFMDSENLILCLEAPGTRTYPDPAESTPHPHTVYLQIDFNIIFPSTFRSHNCSFSFSLTDYRCVCIFHKPSASYWPRSLHLLDWTSLAYLMKSRIYVRYTEIILHSGKILTIVLANASRHKFGLYKASVLAMVYFSYK